MDVSLRLLYKSNMKQASLTNPVPAFALYGEGLDDRFPDNLHIETIRARSTIHDWRIRPHRHHDLHQFFWIASGGGYAQIEGADEPLLPSTAIIMPPLTIHGFAFEPGTSGFVVSIPTTTLDRVLGDAISLRAGLERSSILFARDLHENTNQIEPMLLNAHEEFQNQGSGRNASLLAHATLICLWFARLSTQEAFAVTTKDTRAELVRRYLREVEKHFRSQLALAVYARELGVSITHLSRVCREVLGCSALKVLHDRLVLEAKRNLVYTSMTISQVAFGLGFSDPAYFTRFFTAKVGRTPSAYRAGLFSAAP
jgi:AraC family transcriptional activator of pobA